MPILLRTALATALLAAGVAVATPTTAEPAVTITADDILDSITAYCKRINDSRH